LGILNIKDYDLPELKEKFIDLGEKAYRAEQVFQWIYKEHAVSFDDMTNLSLELRDKLKEKFSMYTFKILKKQISKDGTKKYLFDVGAGALTCPGYLRAAAPTHRLYRNSAYGV